MTTTTNLAITEVATGQTQKEITINNALEALDNAINRTLSITFTTNARTLTALEYTRYVRFTGGNQSAAATLTVPLTSRVFLVCNTNASYKITVGGTSGTTVDVSALTTMLLVCDGTNVTAITGVTTGAVTSVVGANGAVTLADLVAGGVAKLASPTFTGNVTIASVTGGAGTVDLTSSTAVRVPSPAGATDAVSRGYLDALPWKPIATWATATTLAANTYANGSSGVGATLTGNANGAISVDGGSPAANDLVLVKNEASGLKNGLYVVTTVGNGGAPYVLTRHTAMDTTLEFVGAVIAVGPGGTANASTQWECTNTSAPTLGTTAVTFAQLGNSIWNAGTVTALGLGISLSSGTLNVQNRSTITLSGTTTGTITPGTTLTSALVNMGTANGTIALGLGSPGQSFRLDILQAATAHTVTLTGVRYGTDITGFTATTTAAKMDHLGFITNDGTTWDLVAYTRGY